MFRSIRSNLLDALGGEVVPLASICLDDARNSVVAGPGSAVGSLVDANDSEVQSARFVGVESVQP